MIVFFNPLSTTPGKQPLPLSIMALAAVVNGREPWCLVDGNVESDPVRAIAGQFAAQTNRTDVALLAVTVMPGPQLSQAVPVCKAVRAALPHVKIVWGGYFPTQHAATVLASGLVDFVVRSQGEMALLELLAALKGERPIDTVSSLSWVGADGAVVTNGAGSMTPLDDLPDYPYEQVAMERYIHPTYLGQRTVAHNSSFGCPFACSFCAVVAMTNRKWLSQSPARMESILRRLHQDYRIASAMKTSMSCIITESMR
jgi:anaerobic magnesium-protoporphyrin IX monomethyl ester cyclase